MRLFQNCEIVLHSGDLTTFLTKLVRNNLAHAHSALGVVYGSVKARLHVLLNSLAPGKYNIK